MSELALLWLLGFSAGLLSSIPPGPTEFWILQAIIQKKQKQIPWFVAGVILSDLFYAHLAYWGYFVYFHETPAGYWMGVLSAVFLLILGLLQLLKLFKNTQPTAEIIASDDWARSALLGLGLCISNPAFVLFWLYIVGMMGEFGLTKSVAGLAFYYVGITMGDALWYVIFSRFLAKSLSYFKSVFYRNVEYVISVLFILFGLFGLIKFWS